MRESPSKETVASATTTKTTPAGGSESTPRSRAPGNVTASRRTPPSSTVRNGAIQLTIRKKRAKISTFRPHAPFPNSTIPATVKIEYPATTTARIAGSCGAG